MLRQHKISDLFCFTKVNTVSDTKTGCARVKVNLLTQPGLASL